jgi:hypothetical protein
VADFPPDTTFERYPAEHFAYVWTDEPDDYRHLVVMPPVIATPAPPDAPQTDGPVSENTGGDSAPADSGVLPTGGTADLAPAS